MTPPSTGRMLAFAQLFSLNGILLFPAVSMLPGFYARSAGVDLGFLGGVLLAGRVLDAVLDPIIGLLSDRTRGRFGPRKPWVLMGGLIGIAPVWLLFHPGPHPSRMVVVTAFLAIFTVFAVIQIPALAWSAEITRDDRTRVRLNAMIGQATQLGILVMAAAPRLAGRSAQGYTPDVVAALGAALCVYLPLSALLAVARAPAGIGAVSDRPSLRNIAVAAGRNRPLLVFLGGYMLAGLGAGINYGLFYLYADNYLHAGSAYADYLIIATIVTVAVIPAWRRAAARFEKHRVLAAAMLLSAASSLAMLALPPGAGSVPAFISLAALHSIATGALSVLPGAVMADIVDYDAAREPGRRAGAYFALVTLVAKLNAAIGGGLGLMVVGRFGYRPGADNDATATAALLGMCFLAPAALTAAGAAVLWRFPLTTRRMRLVRWRLDRRAAAGEYA